MVRLRQPLPDGPLDLVGDVHGEIDALRRLVHHLGGDLDAGRVARPLVFVGDLIDRGPDSVAVLEAYGRLAERGLAYCVLGNHELNLLRAEQKEGNGWFFGHDDRFSEKVPGGVRRLPFSARSASPDDRVRVLETLRTLPLLLERPDLRVAHAAWEVDAVAALPDEGEVVPLLETFGEAVERALEAEGVTARAREERARWHDLKRLDVHPPDDLPHVADEDERIQMSNPIRRITSGPERKVASGARRYAGGKWRYVERAPWWLDHHDEVPVVVGHYWRSRAPQSPHEERGWAAESPLHWNGARGNVFCVDFSVGRRYFERRQGEPPSYVHGLAALRWPERTLVFDDAPSPEPTKGFDEP
ncbi:MAG: metallophosphoesterase [Bradymonadia bacterium]